MDPLQLPRIIIVDHYDSYTRNLLSLISSCFYPAPSPDLLSRRVVVIPHTHPALSPEWMERELLPHVDALILSPGPGSADRATDFDASAALLNAPALQALPMLGVCLGHQGMSVVVGGAKVVRLTEPFHGRTRSLLIDRSAVQCAGGERSIVDGIADGTSVVCYNSLAVDETSLPATWRVVARSPGSPALVQAIEHTTRPLYGVQFHPESIESDAGDVVMRNFLHNVAAAWTVRDASRVDAWTSPTTGFPAQVTSLGRACVAAAVHDAAPAAPQRWVLHERRFPHASRTLSETLSGDAPALVNRLFRRPGHTHPVGGCVWLDSASAHDPQSHVSAMSRADFVLTYDMDGCLALCRQRDEMPYEAVPVDLGAHTTLWDWMDEVQSALQALTESPPASIPTAAGGCTCAFRTGFAGYWGYEMKDESLALAPLTSARYEKKQDAPVDRTQLPAAQWAFCSRVLSLDHRTGMWTAYALVDRTASHARLQLASGALGALEAAAGAPLGLDEATAEAWFDEVYIALDEVTRNSPAVPPSHVRLPPLHALDDRTSYTHKIGKAQALIAAGESYELCLTTQFEGRLPCAAPQNYDAYFSLYCALRQKNPAPFGAYLELLPLPGDPPTPQAVLSTSPERFLTITPEGHLEMRPIKGTLVRPGWGKGEEAWAERAKTDAAFRAYMTAEDERREERLRMDPKERAENLMIADLIRADLQAVCYAASVHVPRLMALETYETVHQLVTAVTGTMRPGIGCVEAVRRCFPPGSMTGAPKRRSVELLETLERTPGSSSDATRRRGIYSGALGFIGADGASNLSVVIRAVITQGSGVMVGAGGAITMLSTAQGEWDEVLTKLGSVSLNS